MNTFSFRAECLADVTAFIGTNDDNSLTAVGIVPDMTGFPDVEVQFDSELGLEELRQRMRAVEDGHVMVQTLRQCPLSQNSLERDLNIH